MQPRQPNTTLFPYTTLFRSNLEETIQLEGPTTIAAFILEPIVGTNGILIPPDGYQDRKSTRLNSSHVENSYAVFCLKKKNKYCRKCYKHDFNDPVFYGALPS